MKVAQLFYCKGARWLIGFLLLLTACNSSSPVPTTSITADTPGTPTPGQASPTPQVAISATPQPLAAQVNDIGISLAEYQAELARFQSAVGRELSDADRQRVLDDLINQALLAGAAAESGFNLDEAALQTRLDKLVADIGGEQALMDWLNTHGYTEPDFRAQLARSASAAWMRDQILAQEPPTAEQVHASQILTRTAEEANQLLARLQAGTDFSVLAREADPVTAGELGWFPRGYLFFPELEQAAFQLEPGQYSAVIQTPSGFHILYVVERDPQRLLDPQPRLILQEQALQKWLDERLQQSKVEIFSNSANPAP